MNMKKYVQVYLTHFLLNRVPLLGRINHELHGVVDDRCTGGQAELDSSDLMKTFRENGVDPASGSVSVSPLVT